MAKVTRVQLKTDHSIGYFCSNGEGYTDFSLTTIQTPNHEISVRRRFRPRRHFGHTPDSSLHFSFGQ